MLYGWYIYLVAIDFMQHERGKWLLFSSSQTISTDQRRNHIQKGYRHLFHKNVSLWLWLSKMCCWNDSVRNKLFSVSPNHKVRCEEDGLIRFHWEYASLSTSASEKPWRHYLSVFLRKISSYLHREGQSGKPLRLSCTILCFPCKPVPHNGGDALLFNPEGQAQ